MCWSWRSTQNLTVIHPSFGRCSANATLRSHANLLSCKPAICLSSSLNFNLPICVVTALAQKSEALDSIIDQLELALEEAEQASARARKTQNDDAGDDKDQANRKPLPKHLLREEIVLTPGDACSECGGILRAVGEDVSETLEYVPGRFKVIRTVRPKFSCRSCETMHQSPAPSMPIERGRAGPGLLAHVLVSKYADHLPLYRQSQIYRREHVDIDRSTLADWVGRSTALIEPLYDAISRHVMAGKAIHGDDTPVNVLAPGTGKTKTGRLWVYLRDERDWAGNPHPAAVYHFTPDRKGRWPKEHLKGYHGWLHADGYAGFEDLYRGGNIKEVACLAHIRRKFFDIHKAQGSGVAREALERIAALYQIEAAIRGDPPEHRRTVRQEQSAPLIDDLANWLQDQLTRVSGKSALAGAMRYGLTRLKRLRPYLDDGRLSIDNNAAERGMRAIAVGRKNFLFMGSNSGGRSAAIAYTLIETAKLNGIEPQAWLTDVLNRIADHKINRIDGITALAICSAELSRNDSRVLTMSHANRQVRKLYGEALAQVQAIHCVSHLDLAG